MSLNVFHWVISEEFEQMDRYLDLLHTAISDNREQVEASIEKLASTLSVEEREKFYEAYEDEDFFLE